MRVDLRDLVKDDEIVSSQPSRGYILFIGCSGHLEARVQGLHRQIRRWRQPCPVERQPCPVERHQQPNGPRNEYSATVFDRLLGRRDDHFCFSRSGTTCHMQKPVAVPDDLSIGDVRALEDSVQNLLLLWRLDSAWQVENATGTPFYSISLFLVDGLEQ